MNYRFNTETAEKYDVRTPRYTSYPTAPHFTDMTPETWENQLKTEEQKHNRPLSLYFHIPFCERLCYFCGCNMIVTRNRDKIARYLGYLKKEMEHIARTIDTSRPVIQIHWGGGTPSYLNPEEIRWLGDQTGRLFNIDPEAEISAEMNPHLLTHDHVKAFRDAGFNRASIGVQDFDPVIQKTVNRYQSEEETRQSIEWCRQEGINKINLDLMYGLPLQSPEGFYETLDKVIDIQPDRLALFSFAYVPEFKKHQQVLQNEHFPSKAEKLNMFRDATEQLTESGYAYIGMDHFALEEDDLTQALRNGTIQRNFQGYSTLAGADLIAFGVSGISNLYESYAQNYRDIKAYEEALDKDELPIMRGIQLSTEDLMRREIIMDIMCKRELDMAATARKWDIDFESHFSDALQSLALLENDGLLVHSDNKITVTEKGQFFLRNIAVVFDGYFQHAEAVHSKAI